MMTQRFHVPEIACEHCVNAVSRGVSALSGVERVDVVLDSKTVTVEHAPAVTTDAIIAAINDAGYDEVTRLD